MEKAPRGLARPLERLILPFENASKHYLVDCRECGQCILRSTALICPMGCPKHLRNGPCGGTKLNGDCEVPGIGKCVWYRIYKGAEAMGRLELLEKIQPAPDWSLEGSSAWLNYYDGKDRLVPGGVRALWKEFSAGNRKPLLKELGQWVKVFSRLPRRGEW